MALPRTFVSFSSADINSYHMMCAWKAHENIDFNFADFQLDEAINSSNPSYIKTVCRDRILKSDTFILLIGADTFMKTTFVKSEVEVAVEKGCRLIGVNLNHWRIQSPLCPAFFANVGALFVPFSPKIVARALDTAYWQRPDPQLSDHYYFGEHIYVSLGYTLEGNIAKLPPKPNPFLFGKPPWAK
jgi:hypothetical protein